MMKHIGEYSDRELCQKLSAKIWSLGKRPIRLMEVCGSHTMTILKYGIQQQLPENIRLLSGPGCPVCVTVQKDIDKFIKAAEIEQVIITAFSDLMRIPGTTSSLRKKRSEGVDVRVVYSSIDSLRIAEEHPDRVVILPGVGFETTAPTIAAAILEAARKRLKNFFVISTHKLMPPVLQLLMEDKNVFAHGFICPGHVSTIIGAGAYIPLVKNYHIPCVIAGFEPADVLYGIYLLVEQIENGFARVDIAYKRGVTFEGNGKARNIMNQVFTVCDANWRGFGIIPNSGLKIDERYEDFDAEKRFNLNVETTTEPLNCICGEILGGRRIPLDCLLFRKICTPENPMGPCMVSTEGACAAYYKYH